MYSLKSFYDTLETHIRALEALGKSHDSYGDILIPIIHKELPADLIKTLTREHNTNEWKLDELRKAIRKGERQGENNPSKQHPNEICPDPPTAAFAIGQSKNSTYKPRHVPSTTAKRACVYCKGLHSPNNCTVITDKKHRYNIVRDFKLCFNCLNDNHVVSQCKTRGRSTLLKTAISPIEYLGSTVTAHILFDEGSHRSFITSSLARNVGLTAERKETLSLSTFGGTSTSVRRVEVGTINLQTPVGENIPIEVIIVPTIAALLQSFTTIDLQKD